MQTDFISPSMSSTLHDLLDKSRYQRKSSEEDIIRCIEDNPEKLRLEDAYSNLPIHLECKYDCREAILLKCIGLYPESLSEINNECMLPLHIILSNASSTVDSILTMIRKYPEVLRHQNLEGNLPIHIECEDKCRSAILSTCLELYPESLNVTNISGSLPIHLLLLNPASSMDDALKFIDLSPEKLKCKGKRFYFKDYLPLHIECKKKSRIEVLAKCIQLYPESLSICHDFGSLPIHMLLANDVSSDDAAIMMIEDYPEALRCTEHSKYSGEKSLPIHIECKNRGRLSILSKCIELYPESLAISSSDSYLLPLHQLLSKLKSSEATVIMMIEKYPEALKCATISTKNFVLPDLYDIYLPIHIECMNQCRSVVLSKCIELYPESLSIACRSDNLPIHLMLSNTASSIDDVLKVIDLHPGSIKRKATLANSPESLPIHIECETLCRSAIIAKCIELYPESLSVSSNGSLPIHLLLASDQSTIEDAIMMIEMYPESLRCTQNFPYSIDKHLPIHIECINRCRPSVLAKCIDLYPESLAIASPSALPIHMLLWNPTSSEAAAIMLIEKYPEALKYRTSSFYLVDQGHPIHIECQNRNRWSIVSKCMELYPESLAEADNRGYPPLHMLLSSPWLPVDQVLMVMRRYPEALRHQNAIGNLPIHIECKHKGRSAVLVKFIELYPESLGVCNENDELPWTKALQAATYTLLPESLECLRKSLSVMLHAHPASFYHPPYDPWIDRLQITSEPQFYRMILNLLPSCLSSPVHIQSYRDLNWEARSSLLQLWLQIRVKSVRENVASLEQFLRIIDSSHDVRIENRGTKLLMMRIIWESCLFGSHAENSYGIHLGDGFGDNLLRCVLAHI